MRSPGYENTLGEYLRARREVVQPEEVGIARDAGRRVPGLRREEVAELARVSPDYYLRLEQGKDSRPSDQVIAGLSRALLLDDDSRQYLTKLAQRRPFVRRVTRHRLSSSVTGLLRQWSHMPAYVSDANQNVVAVNALATAIAPNILLSGVNQLVAAYDAHAKFSADPVESDQYALQAAAWTDALRKMTAALRFHGDPADPEFRDVVGLLSTRYPAFRDIWALHEARPHIHGTSSFDVEEFGWVEFTWQTLEVPGPADLFVTLHFAEPGSRAADVLASLSTRRAAPADVIGPESQSDADELASRRSSATRAESPEGTKTRTARSS